MIELTTDKSKIQCLAEFSAVAHYLLPFLKGTTKVISNIEAKVGLLKWYDHFIPITINTDEVENSYVCSPYSAYIPYALQELTQLDSRILKWVCRKIFPSFGRYFKSREMDKNLHINNWMLSTNLYPKSLNLSEASNFIEYLTSSFPQHAIIFRSLNFHSNQSLMSNLEDSGFILIPSRQVYFNDLVLFDYRKKVDVKRDFKLLNNSPYQLIGQGDLFGEVERIVDLYNQLYINKYSKLNPQFTKKLLVNMMNNPYFCFQGLRSSTGTLEAVGGYFQVDDTVTMPILGYDMTKPVSDGLYRQIVVSAMKRALDNNLIINASSGAANFKRLRGGTPFIEYSAVYVKHLDKPRQNMWYLLRHILNKFAVPMMKKYKL